MAAGPLARLLAQLVVPVIAVLARAIPAAYQQALQNARKSGMDANNASVKNMLRKTLDKSEALQILNLSESEATTEAIQKQYERYFAQNDVKKGGSFYIQSKVYRAKEMLDEYEKEKKRADEELTQQSNEKKNSDEELNQQSNDSQSKEK